MRVRLPGKYYPFRSVVLRPNPERVTGPRVIHGRVVVGRCRYRENGFEEGRDVRPTGDLPWSGLVPVSEQVSEGFINVSRTTHGPRRSPGRRSGFGCRRIRPLGPTTSSTGEFLVVTVQDRVSWVQQ